MFDEDNEATAVFRAASRRQDAPDQGCRLTLDAGGIALPGDITRMFHSERKPGPKMPAKTRGRRVGRSAAVLLALSFAAAAQNVDPATLTGKVLLGYQGWFRCPAGGVSGTNWSHWANGAPSASTLVIDMYPDMREFETGEACAVPNMTVGGQPARLFSAGNSRTVDRHFLWMRQYGLDGVLAQRFLTDIAGNRGAGDPVLRNIMTAAERHGRVFAIEYDVTGANPATVEKTLQDDWKYLVEELKVASSPAYLRHEGKPVLSVWGLGFSGGRNPPENPAAAGQIVNWFRSTAGVTYMGGTPSRWRTLDSDALADPGWTAVYRSMDIVQPWTIGRYNSNSGVDSWLNSRIKPDMEAAAQNGQLYMPVIFPGFSWHNLNPTAAANQIPRNRGEFLWRQAYNAKAAGATMLKIAMFDEVNESTAMFKVASRRQDAPDQGYWLTLDADGFTLPSDWYLRLAGEIARMFRRPGPPAAAMPSNPGPPWAGEPAVAVVSAASFSAGAIAPDALATASPGGTSITVIDSTGQLRPAVLVYVSPAQINFVMPAGTANGRASVLAGNGQGDLSAGAVDVAPVAPGIFSAMGNGQGPAAAVAYTPQGAMLTFACASGACTATPIDVGSGAVVLSLYGTGIRGRSAVEAVTCTIGGVAATVLYAGPQPEFPGLDQINVALPRSLAGRGLVAVTVEADGRAANAVQLAIR